VFSLMLTGFPTQTIQVAKKRGGGFHGSGKTYLDTFYTTCMKIFSIFFSAGDQQAKRSRFKNLDSGLAVQTLSFTSDNEHYTSGSEGTNTVFVNIIF